MKAIYKRTSIGFFSFGIVTLVFWNLVEIYTSNPDGNHDGIMLAPAIAVKEGLVPNRDFFSLYGPITPLFQGMWLRIFGVSLLQLRIFSLALTILIAVITFCLARKFVSIPLSLFLTLCWLVTGPSGLPWSSLVLNLFYLILIWIFVYTLNNNNVMVSRVLYYVAGFISAACIFVRIQMLLTFVFVSILIFLYDKEKNKFWLVFALGGLSSSIVAITVLNYFDAFVPFIDQGIRWAGNFYGLARIDRSYVLNLIWFPFATIVIFFLVRLPFSKGNVRRKTDLTRVLYSVPIFLFSTLLAAQDRSSVRTLFSLKALILSCGWYLSHWLGLTLVTLTVISFTILSIRSFGLKNNKTRLFQKENVVFFLAATTISQLYPFYDLWHIWFITPVLLIGLISLPVFRDFVRKHSRELIEISVIFVICNSLLFAVFNFGNKYEFTSSILRGMKTSDLNSRNLDTSLNLLKKYGDSGNIKFVCPIGLYAVANSKYMANDLNYVNWGDFKDPEAREVKQIFVCESSEAAIRNYENNGWKIIFKTVFIKDDYDKHRTSFNALLGKK